MLAPGATAVCCRSPLAARSASAGAPNPEGQKVTICAAASPEHWVPCPRVALIPIDQSGRAQCRDKERADVSIKCTPAAHEQALSGRAHQRRASAHCQLLRSSSFARRRSRAPSFLFSRLSCRPRARYPCRRREAMGGAKNSIETIILVGRVKIVAFASFDLRPIWSGHSHGDNDNVLLPRVCVFAPIFQATKMAADVQLIHERARNMALSARRRMSQSNHLAAYSAPQFFTHSNQRQLISPKLSLAPKSPLQSLGAESNHYQWRLLLPLRCLSVWRVKYENMNGRECAKAHVLSADNKRI